MRFVSVAVGCLGGLRAAKCGAESVDGVSLEAESDVGVGGDADVGVAEEFLDDDEFDAATTTTTPMTSTARTRPLPSAGRRPVSRRWDVRWPRLPSRLPSSAAPVEALESGGGRGH